MRFSFKVLLFFLLSLIAFKLMFKNIYLLYKSSKSQSCWSSKILTKINDKLRYISNKKKN